jgi:catechol 2,3-dioxygenase-like lactoylglutathione lyase family enzyme
MKSRLHHVGVIVPDEAQLTELLSLLGLSAGRRQYVPEYEADCCFSGGEGAAVEFIVPRAGKLTKFNRGTGGLHHIALEVEDLEEAQQELAERGVKLLETTPVDAGDIRINFLPPIYSRGVIVEFVQRTAPSEVSNP